MKTRPYHLSLQQGSAMLFVLLLIGLVGLVTAGWITFISARSGYVESMTDAIQRRIALENSKALAQEFMLERVLPSASGDSFTYSLSPSGWGGISVPAWDKAPMLSEQLVAGYNPFNPGNGFGYASESQAIALYLSEEEEDIRQRQYQVRSRSPLLSGYLVTSQRPLAIWPNGIGALTVDGAAFVWRPGLSMSFKARSLTTPADAAAGSYVDFSNQTLMLNQQALPRQIANPSSGSFYNGEFDAISNNLAAANSSHTKALDIADGGMTLDGAVVLSQNGVESDGAGNVTITLNTPELGNVYIPGKIKTLTLKGQTGNNDVVADDQKAILIVVDQPNPIYYPTSDPSSRNLATVTLENYNSRRVILAVKKQGILFGSLNFVSSTSNANWRLLLELENTAGKFTVTGTLTLQGGVRTDRAMTLSSGSVSLIPEIDGKYLERLATRSAWIESVGAP